VLLPIKPGKAEIRLQWRQARFTWHSKGCAADTGYFSYVYEEEMKPVSIAILK
jgi:hypothetical protein